MRHSRAANAARALLAAAFLSLIAATPHAAAPRSGSAPATPRPSGAARPAAPRAPLVVVGTGDLMGKTSPCGCHVPKGGLARIATFADSIRGAYPHVVLADAGGFFPHELVLPDAAAFMIDELQRLGFAAVGVGEIELRFGLGFLKAQVARTGLPMISSNLVELSTGQPLLAPYIVKKVGGVNVGFFSLLSDQTNLMLARDSLLIEDPLSCATRMVPELRKKGATVVVLLSQLGRNPTEDLVAEVPGVDLVICSGGAPLVEQGRMIKKTVIAYPGDQGWFISRTLLKVDGAGRVSGGESACFMLGPEVRDQPATAARVKAFEDARNERLKREDALRLAEAQLSQTPPEAQYLGSETCIQCHPAEGEQWKGTPHARAFQTLVDRQKDATPECVTCHVVGYRQPGGFQTAADAAKLGNVQCENCHGPGARHSEMLKAKAPVGEAVCRSCHDATTSPEFDFAKFKPYVDHAHKFAELPALNPHAPMK